MSLQSFFTMTWVDDWLAGLVHPACRADLVERSRHERFLVARSASVLGALAVLPPYLLGHGLTTLLEGLALAALASAIVALALLSRIGRLDLAQGLVSLALVPFVAAAVATSGGIGSPAVLALAIIPLDALFCGERRAILGSAVAAAASVVLALTLETPSGGSEADLTALLVVGLALGAGHGLAQVVLDHRLGDLVRSARRAGEAREGATLLAIDDLVTWHDRNGSVLRANSAAGKLLGVPPSQLAGRGLFDRIHVADRPAYLKAISDAAMSAEPIGVILRLRTGVGDDGTGDRNAVLARLPSLARQEMVWVELRAYRFPDAEDSCSVVAVTRDVSEHRQRVEDLEALCRRAAQASESRAELLAGVSGELRTPLKAIVDYSELLVGKESSARLGPAREYAQMILETGQRMLGVVASLLDLATIETGDYDLAPEPLDVGELVAESCRSMEFAAERAEIAVAHDVAADLPALHADRRACQQILLHLLSSALGHAPRGGLVTLQARREADRITLCVRETRAGRAHREPPHPSGPFASASGRPVASAGLGLTVVRSLVALQGGRLELGATPGGGFSALVSLPVEEGGRRAKATARIRPLPRMADRTLSLRAG